MFKCFALLSLFNIESRIALRCLVGSCENSKPGNQNRFSVLIMSDSDTVVESEL